jgi:NAD(P)-dependent dehydrogenase (short-subunit alcohol dehydrogenase family)
MSHLQDRAVVVLGGTSGIGAATAALLAEDGAAVVIAGRRVAEGESLAERLGARASFIACDVLVESEVRELMARALIASAA